MAMRPQVVTLTPENGSATTVAAAQTPAGATALTLTTTSFSFARILLITDAADNHTKTLAFVGTDADGNAISETVTCTNSSTTVTTKAYKTITSITASGAFTGNVSVGTRNTTLIGYSSTTPLDYLATTADQAMIEITGTANVTIQETYDSILADGTASAVWIDSTNMSSKSSNTMGALDKNARAFRVKLNTYTDTAVVKVIVMTSNDQP